MIQVSIVSLLPLAAAVLSVFLAASTLRVRGRGNPTVRFFFVLNMATALWAFFYAVELNIETPVVLDLAPLGSWHYVAYMLQIIGLSAAPTYWLLFAAAHAGKQRLTTGPGFWLLNVPFVYGVVIAALNPALQWFVTQDGPGAPVGYGPTAYPHLVFTFALVGWGTWLLIASVWNPGTVRSRRSAQLLAFATTAPFLGGLLWGIRHLIGLNLTIHPVPILFALLNAVLLYQVLNNGLADIIPVAAYQAFRTMADPVLVVDGDGVLVATNTAAERLIPDLQPRVMLSDAAPWLAQHVSNLNLFSEDCLEFEASVADTVLWGRARRTRDGKSRPVGFIVMLTDVTEIRALQLDLQAANLTLRDKIEQLREARSRAEERGERLHELNTQLEEATHAKSRFLANMSHELRTPLNSIIGFSGVLLQEAAGPVTHEQRVQLEMVRSSGRRLLTLIDDILDLTKIEAGRLKVSTGACDLRDVLAAVDATVRPLADEKGLTFEVGLPSMPVEITTDRVRLEQILLNLATNGVKFTDHGGVGIGVRVDRESVEIRVADTGIGIAPDKLDTVFAEFERLAHPDGHTRSGTGLGLAISRQLAYLLRGEIAVESVLGRGSTFTLTIPR